MEAAISSTVRAIQVQTVIALLRDGGVDPLPLLHAVGIAPDAVADPEALVPAWAVGRLGLLASEALHCPHFGLLVAERGGGAAALGFIAQIALQRADVRGAVLSVEAMLRRQHRGLLLKLREEGGTATLALHLAESLLPGSRMVIDASLLTLARLLRVLCGPAMQVLDVRFAYRRPLDLRPYARAFQAPMVFDAAETAVVIDSMWLDQPIDRGRADVQALLQAPVSPEAPPVPLGLAGQVRQMMLAEFGDGVPEQAVVARHFGLSQRALHRRLAAEAASFRAIRNDVRHLKACNLLHATSLSVAEIAQALDYSEASAFTRAFRRRAGCAPSEWRQRVGDTVPAE